MGIKKPPDAGASGGAFSAFFSGCKRPQGGLDGGADRP